jgi:hypothetical protein
MSMLNPTQFDTDNLSKRMLLHYRRGKGRFPSYIINRLQFNYLAKLHIAFRFPPHIDIEPTMLCNMKCPMCFQQHMHIPKDKQFIDFNLYRSLLVF